MPIPETFDRYLEPFFGGGALFFHLRPETALLADLNEDLIEMYRAVKNNWESVEEALLEHSKRHNRDHYYKVRAASPASPSSRAARFLYLNRTCWNGLYRVNKDGEFNVPIGTKSKVINPDELQTISAALENVNLEVADFGQTIRSARSGDFVYVDPPYTVKHNMNGFVKYNQTLFSWDDQVRLRDEVVAASARGARVLVSNAAHESLFALYMGVGKILTVERASVISGKSSGRRREQEILVKCY